MMVSAIVLINTETGTERAVLDQLRRVSGVEEAYKLYSVYDIAIKVNANSIDQLKHTITDDVKTIPQTKNFLTLLTVDTGDKTQNEKTSQQEQLRRAMFLASQNSVETV